MAHKGTHWRQQQKLQKVLELYSLKNCFQFTALKIVREDMKMIGCSESGMWPFTSYSPCPHLKSISGDMSDISFEELRYLKYTSSEDEYVAYEKVLEEDYKYMRLELRYDKDLLMMYLVKEVYIFVCNWGGIFFKVQGVFFLTGTSLSVSLHTGWF